MERSSSNPLGASLARLQQSAGISGTQPAKCPDHGDYIATVLREGQLSGCPECSRQAQAVAEAMERDEQQRQAVSARLERQLGQALIPLRFKTKTFENYRAATDGQRVALAAARRYAADFPANAAAARCLMLLGHVGNGKTHLAAAIANVVMVEHRRNVLYTTVSRVCQQVKASYGKEAQQSEREAIEVFRTPDLLILDEVGASYGTDFERMVMFEVINARYEEMKPTLVISNLFAEALAGALGDRTVDRLREGGGVVVVFDWQSARRGVA
ncbi:ATP-binding protein [Phytopseudomonas argentinensis]|uniref:DNA replication protein DnaC n=1 Tax=Phytopseudomonas argentinensis TaxID=289370 RepID=A0A1I3NVK0_9GAMM|nr:ATP-binding protein [Pseudomonas argentinensis]SFJ12796.1 DNA replication protein DnaC [Pseudomonas argentinensis]